MNFYIIGKGKNLLKFRKEHFGEGTIITLNNAITHIDSLGLSNKIYAMFKDGASPDYLNECPSMDCYNCPYGNVYPKNATILLHKHESTECMPDYPDRQIFDAEEQGLNWRVESVLQAIELALKWGADKLIFIGFDAVINGDYSNINGEINMNYEPQTVRLKERCLTLNHEFWFIDKTLKKYEIKLLHNDTIM